MKWTIGQKKMVAEAVALLIESGLVEFGEEGEYRGDVKIGEAATILPPPIRLFREPFELLFFGENTQEQVEIPRSVSKTFERVFQDQAAATK
jgi:hypothetical protein